MEITIPESEKYELDATEIPGWRFPGGKGICRWIRDPDKKITRFQPIEDEWKNTDVSQDEAFELLESIYGVTFEEPNGEIQLK